MQVLRLLAARGRKRRAVSTTVTVARSELSEAEEDDGPFFDLDFSSSSVRASSSSSSSSDDDDCSELDFIISLHHRNWSSIDFKPAPPPPPPQCTPLRALSFGSSTTKSSKTNSKAAAASLFYGGRPSFAGSTRSLRLFMEEESSDPDPEEEDADGTKPAPVLTIRRYLAVISRRLRRSARPPPPPPPRRRRTPPPGGRGGLRKSRSASAAVAPPRRDDSLVEQQDGIAGAIAHCKASFHRRASLLSDCGDSSLLRSRSDPGKCEASTQ